MTTYVGKWKCSYCFTEVDGYIYDCPSCGHPRAKDVRFYLPENAPVATPEQKRLMGNDPNWYCVFCDSGNHADNTSCWNCGAERDSKSPVHQVIKYKYGQTPHTEEQAGNQVKDFTDGIDWDDLPPPPPPPLRTGYSSTLPRKRKFPTIPLFDKWLNWLVIGGLVAFILFVIYMFFFTARTVPATVEQFNWERITVLQEYQLLDKGGWNQPPDATPVSNYSKQSGWKTVHDGYRTETYSDTCYHTVSVADTCYRSVYHSRSCTQNDGNGGFSTYECGSSSSESYSCTKMESQPYSCTKTRQVEITHQEPVYSTWYDYKVWRWTTVQEFPTSGSDKEPYWDHSYQVVDDKHKLVDTYQNYSINYSCEIGDFKMEYDLETWSSFNLGDTLQVKTNIFKMNLGIVQ